MSLRAKMGSMRAASLSAVSASLSMTVSNGDANHPSLQHIGIVAGGYVINAHGSIKKSHADRCPQLMQQCRRARASLFKPPELSRII
jgi:hypothetical protein